MTKRVLLTVILAGGEGRRMVGADKTRLILHGRPLIRHVIARVSPQTDRLAISCHDLPGRFADLDLPVICDPFAERVGPLGGILAALDWANAHVPAAEFILTVPTDTPFLPADLVARLDAARTQGGKPIAAAASAGRIHPTIALWPVAARGAIRTQIAARTGMALMPMLDRIGYATAEWSLQPDDPFFNINIAADLDSAAKRINTPP